VTAVSVGMQWLAVCRYDGIVHVPCYASVHWE